METFKLREGESFIELNNLLKILFWAQSGGAANQLIEAREVKVNGEIETRKRKKLREGDLVDYAGQQVKIIG